MSLSVAAGCAPEEVDIEQSEHEGTRKEGLATEVYTVNGRMSIDDEYIPRVCTQENGGAPYEALKAQAIAARSYLYRAMRDDPALGTPSKPVINGQSFQAYASSSNAGCYQASQKTRGVVGRYQGTNIIANYVAGALVNADGSKGNDWSNTEKWVTYNEGRTGGDVQQTKLSYVPRTDNRGCMGQNRAAWLAGQGYNYASILRYFYGADLEIEGAPERAGGRPRRPRGLRKRVRRRRLLGLLRRRDAGLARERGAPILRLRRRRPLVRLAGRLGREQLRRRAGSASRGGGGPVPRRRLSRRLRRLVARLVREPGAPDLRLRQRGNDLRLAGRDHREQLSLSRDGARSRR